MGTVATKNFFTDTTSWVSGMIGRSVVIHGPNQTGPRIACANLTLYHFPSARSDSWLGPGTSKGQIRFSQVSPQGSTILNISFTGLNARAGGYHIHILPIKSTQEPCSDTNIMGHFNPFSVNAASSPAPGNGTNNFQNQYTDGNMPLSGPNSIIGRSLVIHYTNSSRGGWGCGCGGVQLLSCWDGMQADGSVTCRTANQQLSCGLGVACGRTIHMVYSNE
uniref:Superoxide dismutase copper/zinc binding domain-containing protein n=1 Tax=Sinocyclocheilus rhinocerous TaxID=307959 RepID=A0A673JJ08_9TELE